jgi:hypothetical protein
MLKRLANIGAVVGFACLVVLSILAVGAASHNQQSRSKNAKHNENSTDQRTKTTSALQINCDPNCSTDNANENGNWTISRFASKSLNDPLTVATLLLVLVVLWQVRDGRRSSERQLRAYLMIQDAKFARPNVSGGDNMTWAIHVIFKNFGKTPAYAAVIRLERKLEVDPPVELVLSLSNNATVGPPQSVPPGHIHTIVVGGLERGLIDFLEARRSNQVCFVWGRVDYIDTFGGRHFTTFQMACNFGQHHQFGYCQNGNGTDDQFRRLRDWFNPPVVSRPTIGSERDNRPVT